MKISELIEILQHKKEIHGDLRVIKTIAETWDYHRDEPSDHVFNEDLFANQIVPDELLSDDHGGQDLRGNYGEYAEGRTNSEIVLIL